MQQNDVLVSSIRSIEVCFKSGTMTLLESNTTPILQLVILRTNILTFRQLHSNQEFRDWCMKTSPILCVAASYTSNRLLKNLPGQTMLALH
jgi:hypothetical protein